MGATVFPVQVEEAGLGEGWVRQDHRAGAQEIHPGGEGKGEGGQGHCQEARDQGRQARAHRAHQKLFRYQDG
jgi:hypothetical protein